MKKSAILRNAIAGAEPVLAMGAHDGLGAKLAEEAGFDAIWASGLEISTSAGLPDANILTMTQFLDAAIEMNQATSIPVICDCDTGFGNSNNVIHMVKQYEAAGMAAVCMEDKKFPKVNSFVPGRQELAPIAEFVGKIMAAKQAQEDPDFIVIARVEALIAGWGDDEAMRRAEAYMGAGADMILMHSKQDTPDEIVKFLRGWGHRCPVVLVPTTYPSLTARELCAEGADVIIYANHGLRTAIKSVAETFKGIRETGSTVTVQDRLVPLRRVFELQGMIQMKEAEKQYLRTGDKVVTVVIPAGGDVALPPDLSHLVSENRPRALLDIYGKPLIQRQVETFERLGIQDITMVADVDMSGYLVDNLNLNKFSGKGPLAGVLAGLETLADSSSTSLVCYSDILFDESLVRNLLSFDGEIGILVDRSFKTDERYRKKSLDLVVCDEPPQEGARVLNPNQRFGVTRISKDIPLEEAHFEFIGMMSMNPAGRTIFLNQAREDANHAGTYGAAASFAEASLTDLLQRLIDAGKPIVAIEQEKGWLEVHDFEDYKHATEQVSRG